MAKLRLIDILCAMTEGVGAHSEPEPEVNERETEGLAKSVIRIIKEIDASDILGDSKLKKRANDVFRLARSCPYPGVRAAAIEKLQELRGEALGYSTEDYIFELIVATGTLDGPL